MIQEIIFSIIVFGIVVLICYPFVKWKLKKQVKKLEKSVTPELFNELNEKEKELEQKIDKEYKEVQDARNKTESRRSTDRRDRIKRRDERRKREAEKTKQSTDAGSRDIETINNETEGSGSDVRKGVQIPDSRITRSIDKSSDASSKILPSENKEGSETIIVEDDDEPFD